MIYEIVGQHRLKPTINVYDNDHDAQPEAPPAATHEDCLGRCGPLSDARTGSRAAAAALSPPAGPESRTTQTNLKKTWLALKIQVVQDQLECHTRYQR